MNAGMVNIETMGAVVTSIMEQCDAFGCIATHRNWLPDDPLASAKYWGLHQIEAGTSIGQTSFLLNGLAAQERHGDGPNDMPAYRFMPRPDIDRVQRFKCVEYLLHLCRESNLPETEGYKALERAADRLARHIVAKSPEYGHARPHL